MFQSEHLVEKWKPLLDHDGGITDPHRKAVTAVLLENQEKFLKEEQAFSTGHSLMESPTNSANAAGTQGGYSSSAAAGGPVAGFDPVLISLIRRSMPNLVAYDLAGVQPMSGPTGLIFAMRSRYTSQSGTEAFYNEATLLSQVSLPTTSVEMDLLVSTVHSLMYLLVLVLSVNLVVTLLY